MLFNVKSISISLAVVYFFVISVIGWICGLSPFTCCKRALLGAVIGYVVTTFSVRVINRILIDAMLKSKMSQQNGDVGGLGN